MEVDQSWWDVSWQDRQLSDPMNPPLSMGKPPRPQPIIRRIAATIPMKLDLRTFRPSPVPILAGNCMPLGATASRRGRRYRPRCSARSRSTRFRPDTGGLPDASNERLRGHLGRPGARAGREKQTHAHHRVDGACTERRREVLPRGGHGRLSLKTELGGAAVRSNRPNCPLHVRLERRRGNLSPTKATRSSNRI